MTRPGDIGGGGTAVIVGRNGLDEFEAYLDDMDGAYYEIVIEIEYTPVAGATPNASRWIGALNAQWRNLHHQVVAVRNIAGTSTPSQHSYGNAVDTFASWPTMDAIFRYGILNHAAFSIRLLILRQTQWYSESGIGAYGGKYHTHVHADFWPQYPL